jgi:hypothetical protein
MKITMMEQLDSMSVTQLKNTKDIIDVMIKNKVKNEMKVGMNVNVVQIDFDNVDEVIAEELK